MSPVKWVFLGGILIVLGGTATGYVAGFNLSRTNEYATILLHIRPMAAGKGKYILDYECDDKLISSFDVDSQKIISGRLSNSELSEIDKISRERANSSFFSLDFIKSGLGVTIGGATISFGRPIYNAIKGQIVLVTKDKQLTKYSVPALVGALSGFYLGFEVATRNIPPCDRGELLAAMQEDIGWLLIERRYFNYLLQRALAHSASTINSFNEDTITTVISDIESEHFNSKNLATLLSMAGDVSPEYISSDFHTMSLYSNDMIFGVYVPSAFLIFGAAWWLELTLASLKRATLNTLTRNKNTRSKQRTAADSNEAGY